MQITDYSLAYQNKWSQKTFGPGSRLKGVLAHIRSELDEVEEHPNDVSEWADLLILTFDGAFRQGFTPKEIISAYYDKMDTNYARVWPDWRNFSQDEAIEHSRTPEEVMAKLVNEIENIGL